MLESCDNCGGPLIRGDCHGCGRTRGGEGCYLAVLVLLLASLAFVKHCVGHAHAQDHACVAPLTQMLLEKERLSGTPRPTFVRHCREAHGGCEARIGAFAEMFVDAGALYNLPPQLLAAVAFRESGLNPMRVGGRNERGIMQIHPCRPDLPANVRAFVGRCHPSEREARAAERWRNDCLEFVGVCQRAVIYYAAKLLAACRRRCTTIGSALGAYNSGHCVDNEYAQRVQTWLLNLPWIGSDACSWTQTPDGQRDVVLYDPNQGIPADIARGRRRGRR